MKVQNLMRLKYFVQLFVWFQYLGFGSCMNMNMQAMQGSAMAMSASGRDFADLDAAEAAVPRRPAIRNSDTVERVMFNLNDPNKELVCMISNGVPTPAVVWMKDNQKNLDSSYFTTSFDAKTGIAKLSISTPKSSWKSVKLLSGAYTCFAANFLGQAQKTFQVQVI